MVHHLRSPLWPTKFLLLVSNWGGYTATNQGLQTGRHSPHEHCGHLI